MLVNLNLQKFGHGSMPLAMLMMLVVDIQLSWLYLSTSCIINIYNQLYQQMWIVCYILDCTTVSQGMSAFLLELKEVCDWGTIDFGWLNPRVVLVNLFLRLADNPVFYLLPWFNLHTEWWSFQFLLLHNPMVCEHKKTCNRSVKNLVRFKTTVAGTVVRCVVPVVPGTVWGTVWFNPDFGWCRSLVCFSNMCPLVMTNIAMEIGPFIDDVQWLAMICHDLPMNKWWFSIAPEGMSSICMLVKPVLLTQWLISPKDPHLIARRRAMVAQLPGVTAARRKTTRPCGCWCRVWS